MVDPTRTAIVCIRCGDTYHVVYLNDLDSDNPYVNVQDHDVNSPATPVGVPVDRLPKDGESTVVLSRWIKNLEIVH